MRLGNAAAVDGFELTFSFLTVDDIGRLNCVEDPIDDFNLYREEEEDNCDVTVFIVLL
jgi:hypothetical protein